MSATTVTGQSGRGIAYGMRGPGNKRNQFVPNVSPHIVAAGNVAMVSGTATVQLRATLNMPVTNYAVSAVSQSSTTAVKAVLTADSSTDLASLVITCGAGTDNVSWIIVTAGQGLDSVAGIEQNSLVTTGIMTV